MHKVSKKIVGFSVVTPDSPKPILEVAREVLNEDLVRPERLTGFTYKLKVPNLEQAVYITINDVILNVGTQHEERRPYEIFINCKNMDNFQWVVALTRLVSAVFRKGGNVVFMIDELRSVFDPHGGYHKKGRGFVPSIVADIGYIIEEHMKFIGFIPTEGVSSYLQQKRAEHNCDGITFPEHSAVCPKCNTKALVMMDNCATCLNCGDSKCS